MSRKPAQRTATRRGAAPAKRKANARRPKRPGLLDQAVAALPFSQATLTRIATWSIVGTVGAVALGVATWFGVPAAVGTAVANVVGDAGLKVDEIQIDGIKRMDKMTVLTQALDQDSRAMPLVDLALVRERLLKYPWVKDARVSRRLPNTLRIFIIEREAAAIWQQHGQLMLVDTTGVPLEPVSTDAMPDLPLLIGEGANAQEPARSRLLAEAPAIKPLVKAATWIGNRRWDLTFASGEKLQLPEGEEAAAKSLRKFAELDAAQGLLRKGTIRFDMRVPGNMVMQRPLGQTATTSVGTGE
ncbi:cell division protein FtsQ [Sphingomonas naasensis]|uniref:Cell division protein FtsQ n=1 Tax=Sphingomonas naasensis TaxID=1344951 RepID=A0A4S1WAT2_9SPHN|nr:cell division protein FtsQ/DivIB [Sphingomonas naasensis]NIJ20627.1 cell division protein FtsQ [Sphingomonas naasensis]TGX37646.1 FtsQ-type POTRA domain-containing protein [Sphingomonas naasensis]